MTTERERFERLVRALVDSHSAAFTYAQEKAAFAAVLGEYDRVVASHDKAIDDAITVRLELDAVLAAFEKIVRVAETTITQYGPKPDRGGTYEVEGTEMP